VGCQTVFINGPSLSDIHSNRLEESLPQNTKTTKDLSRVVFCDIMDPASSVSLLHPYPWQFPQGIDPPKHFPKSIPVSITIVPLYSMDSIIINKPSCFTSVLIYLSVLSFMIIVFYHCLNY